MYNGFNFQLQQCIYIFVYIKQMILFLISEKKQIIYNLCLSRENIVALF
jgi:hypothetical protein